MTRRRRQLLNTSEDLRRLGDLDNVTQFEPRRETVGDLLRRAREGKSQPLDLVATRLKIRSGYLKAIEEGRFQDLPGLTYAVGFVRTYAEHLGLDSEDVVRRFRDEVTELKSQTQLIFPVVASEGKIPRGAILLLSAVLAAIAYGGWYYLSEREQSALDLIPELPAKLKALISSDDTAEEPLVESVPVPTTSTTAAVAPSGEAPAAPLPPTDAAASTSSSAQPAPALAPSDDDVAESAVAASALPGDATTPPEPESGVVDATASSAAAASASTEPLELAPASVEATAAPVAPVPDAAAAGDAPPPAPSLGVSALPSVSAPAAPATGSPASAAPAPDGAVLPPVADGQAFGATEGDSRIVLVARLESWVQVTDPETNALLTRVLRAGDRYYVPDQPGLMLATGNAGGLDIWVDGRPAPSLGPVGVVKRGVTLDAQRLADGTALTE